MTQRKAPKPRSSNAFIRTLMLIFILSVVGVVGYNYVKSNGGFANIGQSKTSIPEEYTINYVPVDFKPQLPDDATVMAILTNPYRYNREFDDLVKNLNLSLLKHVSSRMGLADSLNNRILVEYDKHHPYLRKLYFDDFVALQDSSAAVYEQWYKTENRNAIDILEEISSKYTCFLVNQVITSVIKTNNGKLNIKGSNVDTPCGVAMAEALRPMIKRLKSSAKVEDFSRSKGFIKERVESAIAELATLEVTDKKGLTRSMQTQILGMNVSNTNIEISAISVLKVGFNLKSYFAIDLDNRTRTVKVTLPQPQVLSHEVYPSIDKLDIGWMRELSQDDFNKNFNLLRREFRRTAYTKAVEDKAKQQAIELMNTMLTPLIQDLGNSYKLSIDFKNTNPEPFENPEFNPQELEREITKD